MCKFQEYKVGETVVLNTNGTCPKCGKTFDTSVSAKYAGHTERDGAQYDTFDYLQQCACPHCGTNVRGYEEVCTGNS